MQDKPFTPAAGFQALAPVYDLAISVLTRENAWRNALLENVSPSPSDRILDVGCGTGSLLLRLKSLSPNSDVHGIDPDDSILNRAEKKFSASSHEAHFHHGFLDSNSVNELGLFSKVVSSLVLHQTPLEEKRNILQCAKCLLKPSGQIFIADYGQQRSSLMKLLFRSTIQVLDGVADTQPNAEGCIPILLTDVGFEQVTELHSFATVTGSISIYSGLVHA